jgi:GT2 family glycosyltransferase
MVDNASYGGDHPAGGNPLGAHGESSEHYPVEQRGIPPKILVLIMTYNVEVWIGKLLEAIAKQDYKNFSVCVSDDASTDRTVECARMNPHGNERVISSTTRRGRCAAINELIPFHPQYKYLVLVNAAALPEDSFLSKLVGFAESKGESFGGATPQILDRETMEPYTPLPTQGTRNFFSSSIVALSQRADGFRNSQSSFEVDSFWGCSCILNAKMVDDFRFDEELWIFGEEEDLSARASRAGYRFYWTTATKVPYKMGASTMDKRGVTPIRMYFGLRNRAYLALKYRGLFEAAIVIFGGLSYSCFLALRRPSLFPQILRAAAWNTLRLGRTMRNRRAWRAADPVAQFRFEVH